MRHPLETYFYCIGNVWLHYFVLDTYDCGNTILPANAQAAAIVGEAR